MPQIQPSEVQTFASIKVVGVGGAGGSAINRMKRRWSNWRSVHCYEYGRPGVA